MLDTKKIRNWKEYNAALKKRGEIIFSFDSDYLTELVYTEKQVRGGKRLYSDKMYEHLLTIKLMLGLPWRAAVGFARGLLQKVFTKEQIRVPDYAHACRAASKLKLTIKPLLAKSLSQEGLEVAFDSTGVNVYGTSGWHMRNYSKGALCRKRDQWKKIHVAIDLDTMQVLSMSYTDSNTNDCEVVDKMTSQITHKIKSVRADGAYDTEAFRKIIYDRGALDLIPPATTSKAQNELKNPKKYFKEYLGYRDKMIMEIRQYKTFEEGLKAWKKNSGYHKRSKIETFMFRLKKIFGFHLQHKTTKARINEMIMKMNILNLMASFPVPEYSN